VAAAAGGAFLLAVLVGVVVTRRIAVPLLRVADAAETFADGDRDVRTGVSGPGEIGVVARSVDTMAEAVVRSEDSQRRLASDVAHELRTPLTALQLGLEEVRDGLVEPDAELLTGLHDQSLRLGRIVDDLGALSEAEATGFALRPTDVDLAALAGSETAAQEPRLRAAGLTVTVVAGGPVLVLGDADRLRQVLTNLLSNAARYCRPGDEVAVTVVERDGLARLSVRDTGPGIPADELPHVFERFWRGGSGARTQGSGLGLAVVRELVNAHRGQVHVESDGATGTTFRVDLPLAGRAG
jgi:two-component system sensor histidine kinase BaeS